MLNLNTKINDEVLNLIVNTYNVTILLIATNNKILVIIPNKENDCRSC